MVHSSSLGVPPSKLLTMEEIGTVTSWASPIYPSSLPLICGGHDDGAGGGRYGADFGFEDPTLSKKIRGLCI